MIGAEKEELITRLETYTVYFFIEQCGKAVNNFVSAEDVFDTLRFLLKSEDHWKINFRQQHEETTTTVWRSLLKIDEALFAA